MTIVEICNSALARLGSEPIEALDDNTKRAKLCSAHYERLKKDILNKHPWRFARKRKVLTGSASPAFGFDYSYSLPSDFIRPFRSEEDYAAWEMEGNKILTDEGNLQFIYICTVEEANFPQYFVEALIALIAKEFSYSLVQSNELQDRVEAEYKAKLSEARFTDSSFCNNGTFPANDYLVIRP